MRLIIFFVLSFVIYFFLKRALRTAYLNRRKHQAEHRIKEQQGGEMVEDPMCHTYIPKTTAFQKKVAGEIIYFCGKDCAEAFDKQR